MPEAAVMVIDRPRARTLILRTGLLRTLHIVRAAAQVLDGNPRIGNMSMDIHPEAADMLRHTIERRLIAIKATTGQRREM
jgi:hypothetical protein